MAHVTSCPRPFLIVVITAAELTVNGLILAFWDHYVIGYYVKYGRPTSEQENFKQALRFLRRLYGHLPMPQFGPAALKRVRESMIAAGRCRSLINKDINLSIG
jgi:hypothetical protein